MSELQELSEKHCKDTQNIAAQIAKHLPASFKTTGKY